MSEADFHLAIHSQALIVQDGPLASLSAFLDHTHTRHTVGLLWMSDFHLVPMSNRVYSYVPVSKASYLHF
jgi:hypothetical protein